MTMVKTYISTSLDGFVAGPNQSLENPLGEGGEALHDWVVSLKSWRERHGMEGGEENASTAVLDEVTSNVGAEVMGRGKFGPPAGGPWGGDPWNGWWGDNPPFHSPVMVVTHHKREPLKLSDTTFYFVTDGVEAAVTRAVEAAGGKDVLIGGGASVINQCLAAGLVDEVDLHVAPVILGAGSPLFAGLDQSVRLEQVRAIEAPGVAHLRYRVVK